MVSELLPRSNSPENAGACSNTASLFDGILTATLGFVLVADPSEDVAAQEPRRGMDARSRGFGRDARSPALSSGAHSRSLKELQPPTLGGSPTRRAKTEGTAVVSEGCSSWRISSRAARTSLTTPQRAYSLPRRPSLNPRLLKVPERLSRSMEFTTEQSIAFLSRSPLREGANQNQKKLRRFVIHEPA